MRRGPDCGPGTGRVQPANLVSSNERHLSNEQLGWLLGEVALAGVGVRTVCLTTPNAQRMRRRCLYSQQTRRCWGLSATDNE
jgi:hypothetical protein